MRVIDNSVAESSDMHERRLYKLSLCPPLLCYGMSQSLVWDQK